MGYVRRVNFEGDPKKAIEMVQAMLIQSGYKITSVSDASIAAEHEGGFIRSQSANTIYGASPISVAVKGYRLTVNADYDGIEKAKRFILRLILGLALLLGLVFGIVFGILFEEMRKTLMAVALGVGVPLIQLPIHLIVTPRIMKKRADAALDTLIHNISLLTR